MCQINSVILHRKTFPTISLIILIIIINNNNNMLIISALIPILTRLVTTRITLTRSSRPAQNAMRFRIHLAITETMQIA